MTSFRTRRAVLAGVGTAMASSIAPPVAEARTAAEEDTTGFSWRSFRRVVTGVDPEGRSVVLFDGEASNARVLNGTRITRLWEASGLPVELPLRGDAGATAGNAYRAGFQGTSFYVAELPGGARAPAIPMHRNVTLDYMAILSGRVVLAVEEREIELQAGDTIVQGGPRHTWINRWADPCVLLFVVVTAREAVSPKTGAGS
jgi:mannose-6-phosphate isomerase-like protein (cupin superfamily)